MSAVSGIPRSWVSSCRPDITGTTIPVTEAPEAEDTGGSGSL